MSKIYNIGDFRVEVKQDTQGFTFSGGKECHHQSLTFCEEGQTITCADCKLQVTGFWAFLMMTKQFDQIRERTELDRAQLEAEKVRNLTHRAAIKVEDAWRRRKLVPTCPHCTKPILPGDGFGSGGVGKHYASDAKPMEFRPALKVIAGWKTGDDG